MRLKIFFLLMLSTLANIFYAVEKTSVSNIDKLSKSDLINLSNHIFKQFKGEKKIGKLFDKEALEEDVYINIGGPDGNKFKYNSENKHLYAIDGVDSGTYLISVNISSSNQNSEEFIAIIVEDKVDLAAKPKFNFSYKFDKKNYFKEKKIQSFQTFSGLSGAINTPTARFYNVGTYATQLYRGNPDRRLIFSATPYEWMEASLRYSSFKGRSFGLGTDGAIITQEAKDKSFNLKLLIKDEGHFPAIAVGAYDLAGTGLYDAEFIVASAYRKPFDISLGIGWGNLAGGLQIENPLINLRTNFKFRPGKVGTTEEQGRFELGRFLSGEYISPFGSLIYEYNDNTAFIFEYDSVLTPGEVRFPKKNSDITLGMIYEINENFSLMFARERDSYNSISLKYQVNGSKNTRQYLKPDRYDNETNLSYLERILALNAIGINELQRNSDRVNIEFNQYEYFTFDQLESVINRAISDSGFNEEIVKTYKIAGLEAGDSSDEVSAFKKQEKNSIKGPIVNNNIGFNVRPYLAGMDDFLKVALLLENNTEIIFNENFFFNSNLKLSLADNFDDLKIPPRDTYPEQVRSDVKKYLNNIGENISIGRAQFDYIFSPKKNHNLMFTAGILEDMYSGYGMEYLWFEPSNNFAMGFEVFDAYKRGYKYNLELQDYSNITGFANFYYRNYKPFPFDLKFSYGEYLAGDVGGTLELSRTFKNGARFGIFATLTDVTFEQFGEGSFDKGLFFRIPIGNNFINYQWRPLTKDPGAKLIRKENLYDLLVRFKPVE